MLTSNSARHGVMSRPSRARGLKPAEPLTGANVIGVAPLAGAWIETLSTLTFSRNRSGRAPRGRVD